MCLPGSPDDFTAGQLADKLEQAFVKKTLKETEWALYFRIKQEPGKTLLEFSNRLRRKATVVGFPATVLEQNMMVTFTNGLANENTRLHLMSKTRTKLEECLDICELYELARGTKETTEMVDTKRARKPRRQPPRQERQSGARLRRRKRDAAVVI
ncbi:uncharacterized protein LOC129600874 [Paramacrobiotus metropolitanus]|uniref:uncharacterized protein LOC129600874 n=1 Tax=Paramacrobiotus metropolitanus TaxID=2943436 RepID=UPI0024460C6D|nr:uncharacterized protein LOC129600874 [Paramacrobiotus metropolitanus]